MARKKKRKRRYTRKKKRTGKRRQMGLFAKIGIGLAGYSALNAGQQAMARGTTMLNKMQIFFEYWIGNLGQMFGIQGTGPFKGDTSLKGTGWIFLASGLIPLAIDVIVSKLCKVSMRVGGVPITGRY